MLEFKYSNRKHGHGEGSNNKSKFKKRRSYLKNYLGNKISHSKLSRKTGYTTDRYMNLKWAYKELDYSSLITLLQNNVGRDVDEIYSKVLCRLGHSKCSTFREDFFKVLEEKRSGYSIGDNNELVEIESNSVFWGNNKFKPKTLAKELILYNLNTFISFFNNFKEQEQSNKIYIGDYYVSDMDYLKANSEHKVPVELITYNEWDLRDQFEELRKNYKRVYIQGVGADFRTSDSRFAADKPKTYYFITKLEKDETKR